MRLYGIDLGSTYSCIALVFEREAVAVYITGLPPFHPIGAI